VNEINRVISHIDADGVISAFLLKKIYPGATIIWTNPWEVTNIAVGKTDIICDLPYKEGVGMYFDHHAQPRLLKDIDGQVNTAAKSCARVIYNHFEQLKGYDHLIDHTDRIDAGELTAEEIKNPPPLGKISLCLNIDNPDDSTKFKNWLMEELLKKTNGPIEKRLKQIANTDIVRDRYKLKNGIIEELIVKLSPSIETANGMKFMIFDGVRTGYNAPASVVFKLCGQNKDIDVVIKAKVINDKNRVVVHVELMESPLKKNNVNLSLAVKRFGGGGNNGRGNIDIPIIGYANKLEELMQFVSNGGAA
jgi:hypothetical protein